jgi:formylglycine-generating enzyme required for sulfatase activity
MDQEQHAQLREFEEALEKLKSLKGLLSEEQFQAALSDLEQKRLAHLARADQGSAIAQGAGATALADGATMVQTGGGDAILGDVHAEHDAVMGDKNTAHTIVIAKDGAKVFVGEQPIEITAVERESILGKYLEYLISRNRYLQLQGIRSGGKLVNIELEEIYITLRATQQRTIRAEEDWLAHEAALAPGERGKMREPGTMTETVNVTIDQALAEHRHLVILGDPGSGKTTLLRYLTLQYARAFAEGKKGVHALGVKETGLLPILLSLRGLGAFLREHHKEDDGTEGHALLLAFMREAFRNERIALPDDFFDVYLHAGKAVVLLDGLDEVADPDLRRRVSQLVETFTLAYPKGRFVVTSRVVGYTGAARLGSAYTTTTVRDFSLEDVEHFLSHWHRLVAVGQMGPGEPALQVAQDQTAQLLAAIRGNERVRELAINPLMLTVIALVHRDRVKLPDRRAELYAEAVDVFLGKWDEVKGLREIAILDDKPFDAGDKRLMLQAIALHMHENQQKEISSADLRRLLSEMFADMTDKRGVRKAVERFQQVIEERTGLLVARGEGVYAFSHLTFQEYLAATAIAARDDYLEYTLVRSGEAWWREIVLLEAGFLSTLGKEKPTRLIRAIAEKREEPVPYHNLVLAAECLRDVGSNRIVGNLETQIQTQLRAELETPTPKGWLGSMRSLLTRGLTLQAITERRIAAANALAQIGGQQFWTLPYGEPVWVKIQAGEFWMGEGKDLHKLHLENYQISRVPITNAQYALFVKAARPPRIPDHWEGPYAPKGRESHPVVGVSWDEALAYCEWLGKVTGKLITLPSEAEWEKAARGDKDQRTYPWGETFEATRCNTRELGLGDTTPVGIFLEGASPYGLLDLSGNVWEWTRTIWDEKKFIYPYKPNDGRENLKGDVRRVLRGGAFYGRSVSARCSFRLNFTPDFRYDGGGCRLVVSPSS